MTFNPEIFRANDIRGIYGQDFDDDLAFYLGLALVRYLRRRKFLVAHDNRVFSPGLAESFIKGVLSAGGDVGFLSLATTPLFNFAFQLFGFDGGVFVTASHNPAEYGGFKIFGESGRIVGLHTGLERIKNMLQSRLESSKSGGKVSSLNKSEILDKYINFILGKTKAKSSPTVKFWVESPIIVQEELKQLFEKSGLNSSPTDYNVKFVFDEDGDRISVFGNGGKLIPSDCIVAILAQDELCFWSRPKVVYDLRFSRGVLEKFREWGIKHFRSRVGRAFIKDEAVLRHASISGELSGHIFFKEADYNELPLLAMLRILKIMDRTGKSINELVEPFKTWENSGEINIATSDQHLAFNQFLERALEKYKNAAIDRLDGITVEYPDWWFNARPSNTEPLIRLVVEAKTKNLLNEKVEELTGIIR